MRSPALHEASVGVFTVLRCATMKTGRGKAWPFRVLRKHEIAGSNPAVLTDTIRCGRVVRRLPVKETIGGSIPPTGASINGRASQLAMAPRSNRDELHGLEGSTPSLSAFMCPWPSGKGSRLPTWRGGFDSHRALFEIGDRLMVGHLSLNQEVKVQSLLPELVGI